MSLKDLSHAELIAAARRALEDSAQYGKGGRILDAYWFEFVNRGRKEEFTALREEVKQAEARRQREQLRGAPETGKDQPMSQESESILARLSAPFDPTEVKFKPAVVSGNRAMALAYVDARVIQDRLDEALGVDGWQDAYKVLDGGSVVCRLRLRIGGEWVTKMDVGSESEQPDGGDRVKAAFSDALKRAAVKFGVGRYLYRLPQQWVDYDPQKRRFARDPELPAWARPAPGQGSAPASPAPQKRAAEKANAAPPPAGNSGPQTGVEFETRLVSYVETRLKEGRATRLQFDDWAKQWGGENRAHGGFANWPQSAWVPFMKAVKQWFDTRPAAEAPAPKAKKVRSA